MKTYALVALLFAVIFIVSSAMAVETSKDDQEKDKNQVGSSKQYGCRHGCCRYSGHRCVYCCPAPNAEEATLSQNQYKPQPEESNPVNDEKYGGWGGGWGGGGHGGGGWGGGGHGGGGWGGGGHGGGWGGGGRGGGRCCGKDKESKEAKP